MVHIRYYISQFYSRRNKTDNTTSMRWIYDIEIYKNFFLIVFKNCKTEEYRSYEISPWKDDKVALVRFLKDEVREMVGYNNLGFDYPIIHFLITSLFKRRGRDITKMLFLKAQEIIKSANPWSNYVRSPMRKQIDLFKIRHYDNKAKITSLKLLQFNLRMENIQELPYPFDTHLTENQAQVVRDYCVNDIEATYLLYLKTTDMMVLREQLKERYAVDFSNDSDSKIGEKLMLELYCRATGKNSYLVSKLRTHRDKIVFREIINSYIKFFTPEFQALHEWFLNQTITETKGVFTGIPIESLTTLRQYMVEKLDRTKTKQKDLNILFKGVKYVYGLGGIHGVITESGVYESDEDYIIKSCDVSSLYPAKIVIDKAFPAHLGEAFPETFDGEIVSVRITEKKKPKGERDKVVIDGFKLAANSVYGKSNSEYSWLCDPQLTMTITINNQLLLSMLAEALTTRIPDSQLLLINTDGLEIKIPRKYAHIYDNICSQWCAYTKFELEHEEYKKLIIRDVNNYIGVFTNGYVKRKGDAFIYERNEAEMALHKNHSALVVPMALQAYFIDGILPEDFIQNHEDIYDFFLRVKLPKSYHLIQKNEDGSGEEELQRLTRYYIATEGKYFFKMMPPLPKKPDEWRMNAIEKGYKCAPCNDLRDVSEATIRENLDYSYYIHKTYKIISQII